jgi:hypothetical protein
MNSLQRTSKDITDSIEKLCITTSVTAEKEKAISSYIIQKTLRIASATLLLTDVMDKEAPVRQTLQKTSIGLVEDAAMSVSLQPSRESLLARLRTLSALFDTALLARLLSESNIAIMQNEINALAEFAHSTGWVHAARTLGDALLHVDVPVGFYTTERYQGPQTTSLGQPHYATQPSVVAQETREYATHETRQKDTAVHGQQQQRERMQGQQKDRRAVILTLLQRKDRINIKDVTAVVKDVSDKTIQRELLSLVAQGVLVKEGERRWSTYRLA